MFVKGLQMIIFKDTLRGYQKKAFSQALKYYKTGKIFRYNICVGGGKTTTAIQTAEKVANGKTIVIACHTQNLINQFRGNVAEQLGLKYVQDIPAQWQFYTYQSLVKKSKKDIPDIGMLVIDETHQGGQSEFGSYRKIIETLKPKKVLGLSATDAGLSEGLFGKKTKSNTFTFSFSDAKKEDVLNDCQILTIHTGLEQHLEGISQEVISGNDLEDIQKQDQEMGVNLSDIRTLDAINEANIFAAVETYFLNEARPRDGYFPQAVFFVGTTAQADMCRNKFHARYMHYTTNAKLKNIPGSGDVVRVAHSSMKGSVRVLDKITNEMVPKKISLVNIDDFREKKFPVLINVKQIQEGFNDPSLELIFDCAPSFNKEGRIFIQRIGRALRIEDGKLPSRYYTFYKATGRLKKFNGEKVEEVLAEHIPGYRDASPEEKAAYMGQIEVAISAELAEHSCDTDTGMDDVLDIEEVSIDLDSFEKPVVFDAPDLYDGSDLISSLAGEKPRSITVTRSDFIVTKARGQKVRNTVMLHDLLKRDEDRLVKLCKDDPEAFIAFINRAKGM